MDIVFHFTTQAVPYWSHADGRCIYVYNTTNTDSGIYDVIYYGTDGGIRKKRAGSYNFVSITGEGLGVTEFYGLGNTEANENIMMGGAQDCGGFSYIKARSEPWQANSSPLGGDGYTGKIMRNGTNIAFNESNGPELYSTTFLGTHASSTRIRYPNWGHPEGSALNRPLYFD